MTHFVFCHGFGFDTQFWEPIAPYFSQEKCSFIDLGYFGNPVNRQDLPDKKIIGIGHSIGLSKLISMHSHFHCLIGLNGFINFLGSDQTLRQKRQKALKALRLHFLKDPDFALRDFYTRCDTPELIERIDFLNLNRDLIFSDFEWLEKDYKLPSVPILILSSEDDMIVPPKITSDNFLKQPNVRIDTVVSTGHALGFKKPSEVYEKIMNFLNDSAA